jgi:protein tyrosine/serine phosphatase
MNPTEGDIVVIRKSGSMRKWLLTAVLPLLLTTGYILYLTATGNFHTITPGEAYRSAQLDSPRLEHYIRKYGIRSVVNLRGRFADEAWYINEIKTCSQLGVKHYDLELSALHEPDPSQVQQLLGIFKTAPRPVLIHCQGGADRSGLVAAMWKVIVDKQTKANAEKQLTIWDGHIPIRGTVAMDRFYEKWIPTN